MQIIISSSENQYILFEACSGNRSSRVAKQLNTQCECPHRCSHDHAETLGSITGKLTNTRKSEDMLHKQLFVYLQSSFGEWVRDTGGLLNRHLFLGKFCTLALMGCVAPSQGVRGFAMFEVVAAVTSCSLVESLLPLSSGYPENMVSSYQTTHSPNIVTTGIEALVISFLCQRSFPPGSSATFWHHPRTPYFCWSAVIQTDSLKRW
jgi:hypothetical protein